MGINWKCGFTKCLSHYHARSFVAYAWQSLQVSVIIGDLTIVAVQELTGQIDDIF